MLKGWEVSKGLHPTPGTTFTPVSLLTCLRESSWPCPAGDFFRCFSIRRSSGGFGCFDVFLDIQVATKSPSVPQSQVQPRTAEQSAEKLKIHCGIHLEGWWVATPLVGEGIAQVQEDAQHGLAAVPGRASLISPTDVRL